MTDRPSDTSSSLLFSPSFCPPTILPPPQWRIGIPSRLRCFALGSAMGTVLDHRRCAEDCVAMARSSEDDRDKGLWLTLAQSWVRLAEQVAQADAEFAGEPAPDEAS